MPVSDAKISLIVSAKNYATNVLNSIGGSLDKLERKTRQVNQQFEQFRGGFNKIANGAKVALGAIVTTGGAIAYFGQETENAMASASTMFDTTTKNFKKYLNDDIRKYSVRYAQNLNEMWEATYAFGSAGASLEDVPNLLNKVGYAAVAGGVKTKTAFEGAIKQIKGFGLEMADIEKVFAVQFQAVQKGLLTYEELATTIPEIAASARTLGENWVDATATFAALTKFMPNANQAATALRASYTELTKKTEALEKAGISLYKNGEFIGFTKVVEQLSRQLEGKTNEEVAKFINNLGLSEEANKGIVNLVNNFEDLDSIVKNTTDDTEALYEMFEKQTSTFAFSFRRFIIILDSLKQTIYEAFSSTLGKWIKKAGTWIQALTKWISENKDKFVELVGAIVRLLGVIIGFNIALNIFSKLGSILTALTNPFTWIIGAIAAVFSMLNDEQKAAAIEWIGKAIDNVISYVKNLFELLSNDGFMAVLQKIFKDIGSLFGNIGNFTIGVAVEVVKWLGDKIPKWIDKGKQTIDMLIDKVDESGLPQWAKNILKGTLNTVKLTLNIFGEAYNWLKDIIGATKEMVLKITEGNGSAMGAILEWLKSIQDDTINFAINVTSSILSWLAGLFGADKKAQEELEIKIKGTMLEWYENMKEWEKKGLDFVVNLITGKDEFEEKFGNGTLFEMTPLALEKKKKKWWWPFAEGGYTGNGGKYQPAGIVHAGEYVIPQWLVKKAPELVGALENVRKKGYAKGGPAGFLPGYNYGGIVTQQNVYSSSGEYAGKQTSLLDKMLSGFSKYFFSGGIGSDVTGVLNTMDRMYQFIKEYIPSVSDEAETIKDTVEQMLGISKSSEDKQTGFLKQLTTLYSEFGSIITEDGKAGNLTKLFTVVPKAFVDVGVDIAQTSYKGFKWIADKISAGGYSKLEENIKGLGNNIGSWLGKAGGAVGGAAQKAGGAISAGWESGKSIPIIGSAISGIEEIFNAVKGFGEELLGPITQSVGMLQNVQALLNPITTIVQSIMAVIGPLINSALQPFVNILKALGQIIGTVLMPILNPLFGVLQALGNIFAWMYNSILVPVGQGMYKVFGNIANGFNWLYNEVSNILKWMTFGALDLGKRTVKSMEQISKEAEEKISKIDIKDGDFEENKSSQYTSSVQRTGPETVYQTINIPITDAFIMDGRNGFKEFMLEVWKELVDEGQIQYG